MKIGLLTIATNLYTDFIHKLYESADKYFCKDYDTKYYLFTNNVNFNVQTNKKYKILFIDHEKWPFITLKRYHIFSLYEKELLEMDYLYYCDADMLFVNNVQDDILGERVATIHPGFYNKNKNSYTYETNLKSKAYISKPNGKQYYAGGFNGGSTEEFLKMSKILKNNIDIDLKNNIIAKWHDESHLNHYYNITTTPTLELSPSYCYPENWCIPFDKKILALDKNHKKYQV